MKINEQVYNQNLYFCGKNRYSNFVEKFSPRDIYSDAKPEEFLELRTIYNNLWKKLDLPENLKPRIQFKAMLSNMAFSIENYMIYIEKRFTPFKMNLRNKTGKNESILRHEIEHVKQIWDVIRLVGADNIAEKLNIEVSPALLKKMREIENTLGKISPDTKEYFKAQQYLRALKNYPDTNEYRGVSLIEIIEHLKYKNNLLEKEAEKEAAKYQPKFAKTLNIAAKEFFKLLRH